MADRQQMAVWQIERIPTGVPKLDWVIDGGLTRGGLCLIVGGPGTGKTVLAEQMAFHWASQGKNTLWLVTLGEPNEKFLINLSEMQFFDRGQIGATIQLINLARYLRQGIEEQLDVIRETIRSGTYSFVVLDGFQSFRCFLRDEREVRLFLSELSSELALAGVTLIVTIDADPRRYWAATEFAIADSIIILERATVQGQERRRLWVPKLRGRPHLSGAQTFTIDNAGLHVHPRLEAIVPQGRAPISQRREPFGVPGLDHLLGGGLLEGSNTLVAGSLGTGKSVLATHFLAEGARQGAPSLHLCLFDGQERFLQHAEGFGLPLQEASRAGLLEVEVYEPGRWDPDSCAERILRAVEERGIRRLVIDSLDPLERELEASGRTLDFMTTLVEHLQRQGVTSLFTYELPGLITEAVRFQPLVVGQVATNLILLRFGETEGRLRRLLTVIKTRYAQHSTRIAELLLEEGALEVVPHPSEKEGEIPTAVYYGERRGQHEGERLQP